MYKYTVYIEAKDFVLPLVIYAENRKKAGKKGIDQFNRIFKNRERIVTVTVKRDKHYFGWYEC